MELKFDSGRRQKRAAKQIDLQLFVIKCAVIPLALAMGI